MPQPGHEVSMAVAFDLKERGRIVRVLDVELKRTTTSDLRRRNEQWVRQVLN